VILFVLRTKTTAKCRRHPTQSRSCVTHGVAYSYCHIFEFLRSFIPNCRTGPQ